MTLPGLQTRPTSAELRTAKGRVQLEVADHDGGFAIMLPEQVPATLLPVVSLRFDRSPIVV